jgi:hypothetical protein
MEFVEGETLEKLIKRSDRLEVSWRWELPFRSLPDWPQFTGLFRNVDRSVHGLFQNVFPAKLSTKCFAVRSSLSCWSTRIDQNEIHRTTVVQVKPIFRGENAESQPSRLR